MLLNLDLSFYLSEVSNYTCTLDTNENRNLMIHNWGQEGTLNILSFLSSCFPSSIAKLYYKLKQKMGGPSHCIFRSWKKLLIRSISGTNLLISQIYLSFLQDFKYEFYCGNHVDVF